MPTDEGRWRKYGLRNECLLLTTFAFVGFFKEYSSEETNQDEDSLE